MTYGTAVSRSCLDVGNRTKPYMFSCVKWLLAIFEDSMRCACAIVLSFAAGHRKSYLSGCVKVR